MKFLAASLMLLLASALAPVASGEAAVIPPDHLQFFEKKIRPVLVEHCYKCHSAEADKIKGGFTLDTQQGSLLGGESGQPGVTPT